MVASHEKNMHKEATNANWIKVSVAGLGKALRMAFEEVFVRALDRYQIMQSIYTSIRTGNSQVRGRGGGRGREGGFTNNQLGRDRRL
jgi:hypothetical protein